jgi:hypothetical protein
VQNIFRKILSISLCSVYILASCGIVRHICTDDNGVAYVSLLVSNECNHCLEHQTAEHQCCNHHENEKQAQTEDEDCCAKTVETISSDQDYFQSNKISSPIFFNIVAIVCNNSDLPCNVLAKSVESDNPLFVYKTPLIYHTGQLRL